jgi:hypothetical protein
MMLLLLILATAVCATFGPENELPPDLLWSELDGVRLACYRSALAMWLNIRRLSAVLGETACMQALEMSCDDASVLLGNSAYLLVLLITFPLALLQGASAVAIFQLGVAFIATESITPYVPFLFKFAAEHPRCSLVFITLVCMAVAERAIHTVSIWELRIPQADNPVLWEAVLMLFLVRCTLPWATVNVSLLVGVINVR